MFYLVSLYFVSFVLLGFLVFALVFPCIAFFCLFCVFCYFYSSTDLLCVCFAVLHPLLCLFSAPPPRRASNAPFSVRSLLARDRFYFPVFLLFLLVISLVSISLLWGVMLGPDLWVGDVNAILAFGSRKTSVGLRFLALSVKK
jgi:hypothetical protein